MVLYCTGTKSNDPAIAEVLYRAEEAHSLTAMPAACPEAARGGSQMLPR